MLRPVPSSFPLRLLPPPATLPESASPIGRLHIPEDFAPFPLRLLVFLPSNLHPSSSSLPRTLRDALHFRMRGHSSPRSFSGHGALARARITAASAARLTSSMAPFLSWLAPPMTLGVPTGSITLNPSILSSLRGLELELEPTVSGCFPSFFPAQLPIPISLPFFRTSISPNSTDCIPSHPPARSPAPFHSRPSADASPPAPPCERITACPARSSASPPAPSPSPLLPSLAARAGTH